MKTVEEIGCMNSSPGSLVRLVAEALEDALMDARIREQYAVEDLGKLFGERLTELANTLDLLYKGHG